jgi:predicted oxidoreductase
MRERSQYRYLPDIQTEEPKDMLEATWKPHEEHGRLTAQSDLPDTVYAFPKQRKEPLTDAQHVRNAVARFDQVLDVSDVDRALAFANIEKAANHYGVNLTETSWHDLGIHPQKNGREAAAERLSRASAEHRAKNPVVGESVARRSTTRK